MVKSMLGQNLELVVGKHGNFTSEFVGWTKVFLHQLMVTKQCEWTVPGTAGRSVPLSIEMYDVSAFTSR